MTPTRLLLILVGFIAGFVALQRILAVLWAREQVKKDLRKRSCAPIWVRWSPLAYWAWGGEIGFSVTFMDSTECIQTGRCAVWYSQVRWISDDTEYLDRNLPAIGRLAYSLLSLALIWFGVKHLVTGKLVLPPSWRQVRPHPILIHGWPLVLICFAALSQAASLVLELAYARNLRANPRLYTPLARGFSVLSWVLFWLSFGLYACETWDH